MGQAPIRRYGREVMVDNLFLAVAALFLVGILVSVIRDFRRNPYKWKW